VKVQARPTESLVFHTIAKIKAGSTPNPTIDTVKKIADALGVGIDDLMK